MGAEKRRASPMSLATRESMVAVKDQDSIRGGTYTSRKLVGNSFVSIYATAQIRCRNKSSYSTPAKILSQ